MPYALQKAAEGVFFVRASRRPDWQYGEPYDACGGAITKDGALLMGPWVGPPLTAAEARAMARDAGCARIAWERHRDDGRLRTSCMHQCAPAAVKE